MHSNQISRRAVFAAAPAVLRSAQARRPNILFAISDDQSYPHTGAMGDRVVRTPHFDRVAGSGVLFRQAYSLSPGCAPSRAGILTGRYPWQLEEAGTHASLFPRKLTVFPDLLRNAGYFTGLTGKGAGPCNFRDAGWPHNPAGPSFDQVKLTGMDRAMSSNDYAGNFQAFLSARPKDTPFFFWYGASEPHRSYVQGSGRKSGKRIEDVVVPSFLPDTEEIRSDILDYYLEIEHFDKHLGRMLDELEKRGELENTLVVVTSDNGMSFPGAKAAMYDYGIHLPLAAMWKAQGKGGRTSTDLVSFADFAPTFLEAAGLARPGQMVGRSLLPVLRSTQSGRIDAGRKRIFSGRERHSHARFDNLGYPARAMREGGYLYVWNMKPERWPAGDPEWFADIDGGPTKDWMMAHRNEPKVKPLFELGFGRRPAEQLFDISRDPGCLRNLATDPAHQTTRKAMRDTLEKSLTEQQDPRLTGNGDIWERYPRYSAMRPQLGGFAEQGKYNPKYGK
jgi:uncharacterized sulfatase